MSVQVYVCVCVCNTYVCVYMCVYSYLHSVVHHQLQITEISTYLGYDTDILTLPFFFSFLSENILFSLSIKKEKALTEGMVKTREDLFL